MVPLPFLVYTKDVFWYWILEQVRHDEFSKFFNLLSIRYKLHRLYVKLCRAMCKLFLVLVGKLKKFYSFEVGEMAFPNDELIPNTVVAIILYPIKLKKLSTVGT